MSQIHFIGGEKGGVGKSVISRLLAQYFIDRDISFKAFDADQSHGAMLRYYADYAVPIDINEFDNADQIAEETIASDTIAIVDMAAQTSKSLNRWIDESGLLDLAKELALKVTFWHVMDDGSDSIKLLHTTLETYRDKTNYVLVRNFGRGSNFDHFAESATAELATELGARTIDVPGLHAPTMRKIDHINASFWAAANNNDNVTGPTLGLLERQRVKTWLNKSYKQLDELFVS